MTTASLFKPLELVAGNVKAAMKAINVASSDLWKVPLDKLTFIDGFNARQDTPEYLAHIEAIAQSILSNGYYPDKPIAAFVDEDGSIKVTDGHSRVRGARRAVELGAPLETLPTVVKPRGTTMEDLTVGLVVSNTGKPLTPFEVGIVVKRLIDMGLAEKDVAKRLGFTLPYVQDLLALVAAPKPIRDMVVAGQVSATAAIKELTTHGGKAVERLKQGLERAKAAGKGKVTGKHLDKPAGPLRLTGKVNSIGLGMIRVILHVDTDVDHGFAAGDEVVVTIKRKPAP